MAKASPARAQRRKAAKPKKATPKPAPETPIGVAPQDPAARKFADVRLTCRKHLILIPADFALAPTDVTADGFLVWPCAQCIAENIAEKHKDAMRAAGAAPPPISDALPLTWEIGDRIVAPRDVFASVNGQVVTRLVAYSIPDGWVKFYLTNDAGELVLNRAGDGWVIQKQTGRVHVGRCTCGSTSALVHLPKCGVFPQATA